VDGRWAYSLEAKANHALRRVGDALSGKTPTNSSEHLTNLDFAGRLVFRRALGGPDLHYVSAGRMLAGNTLGGFVVPNLTLFRQGWVKGFNVSRAPNLCNTRYGYPGSVERPEDAIRQDSLTFQLKLNYPSGLQGAEQVTCTRSSESVLGRALLLSLVSLLGGPHSIRAQTLTEYRVKAAFLYNFAKLVEGPPDAFHTPSDPFAICTLGENPFGDALSEAIKGKSFNGRGFVEKNIISTEVARGCHILFVSSSEHSQVRAIAKQLRGASILTVGDTQGFAPQGVIINFVVQDNKVRFEFNAEAAERAQLKASSKLLNLAKIVR